MPDFELRFVAVPEIKQDADKDLRKQWERRFQNQVVGKLAVDAEIPKQTLTKLRNQYAQIMNDLGKTTLDVGRDIAGLRQQYGKAFDMTGITDQFKSDLAKTGNTIESLTQAAEKHAAQVRQLESEYVNLKAKRRPPQSTNLKQKFAMLANRLNVHLAQTNSNTLIVQWANWVERVLRRLLAFRNTRILFLD